MKRKSEEISRELLDENYYQKLIANHKIKYQKEHEIGWNEARDKNYFDQYFIDKILDPRKREIEQLPAIYPFLQIVHERLALSKATRFEILINYCEQNNTDTKILADILAEYDAILSVWNEIRNEDYYEIDTATIYYGLQEMWANDKIKSISRDELFKYCIEIEHLLRAKKVESYVDWQNDAVGLEDYVYNRHKRELELSNKLENFPYPSYFIVLKNSPLINDEIPNLTNEKISTKDLPQHFTIISFDQSCIVNKSDKKYDVFFALQLYTVDIMDIERFLQYHLRNTFESDSKEYTEFLEKIILKHKQFLHDLHEPIISNVINSYKEVHNNEPKEIKEIENKDFTIRRRVIAMNYLLEELKVSNVDKTNIARFIQFFSGKESSVTMDNNEIYKKVKNPFAQNNKASINDLKFILPFFENLNLHSIVEKIKKEMVVRDRNSG